MPKNRIILTVLDHLKSSKVGTQTHILVAGSSIENVNTAKAAVAKLDFVIEPAPSMSLALFLAQKNLPDLIVCDTEMTDGDPFQFLQELKADDELSAIPFVFLCPQQLGKEDRRKMLAAGADGILLMPIEPAELLEDMLPYIRDRQAKKTDREEHTPE